MSVTGVDLSNHQSTTPDLSSYGFVFHKATQGNAFLDKLYPERHTLVRSLGKVFGAYLFMETTSSAQAQVDFFRSYANIQLGDVVILDFENDGTWNRLTNAAIARIGTGIMSGLRIAYPNNRILLYCDQSTYTSIVAPYRIPVMDGLWIAWYNQTPPNDPWLFWQYADTPLDEDMESYFPTQDALWRWTYYINVGDIMSGFGPGWEVDYAEGRAWTVLENGPSNSQVIKTMWVAASALWGDIPNARVTFTGDDGAGWGPTETNVVPNADGSVTLKSNHRAWWKLHDGVSKVTVEWNPAEAVNVKFGGYSVWE